MGNERAPSIVLLGTGGSSGRTLALVEDALRRRSPDVRITFLDTQPFNLRTGGATAYPGRGEVRRVAPDAGGIRRWTGSQTANLLLNGGPIAYRGLRRYMAEQLGGRHDALLMCHDRIYIETAAIHAARASGTPTILLQEGPFCVIGHGAPQNMTLRLKAMLAPLVNSSGIVPAIPDYGCAGHDRILAASEDYRRRWIAAGVAAARIETVGVPRYDPLPDLRKRLAATPRRDGPLRLLYLVQPFAAHGKVDAAAAAHLQRTLAAGVNRAVATRPIELVVRSHPRSGQDDVTALRETLRIDFTADDGTTPLEHALEAADLVIGHYSSGLLESVLLGKAILCVPVPIAAFAERTEADKQQWITRIGAPVADTVQGIADGLTSVGTATIRWDLIEQETGMLDGGAALRAADAVLRMIERGA